MSEKHKLKTRIANLLKHAKGTDNEAEAEAFLAKAMDLMERYQIDASALVDENDPVRERLGYTGAASGHAWRWNLLHVLAVHYGCKTILMTTKRPNNKGIITSYVELHITGRESAHVTLDLMYPFICKQVTDAGKAYAAETGMSPAGAAKRVALALQARIHVMTQDAPKKDPSTPAGRNAVVIMDQVEAAFKAAHPATIEGKARKVRLHNNAQKAAAGISLHRQTSGASQKRLA